MNNYLAAAIFALSTGTGAFAAPLAASLPTPVASEDLASMIGGAAPNGIAITTQDLSASNSNNSLQANSIVTGDINVPAGAFSGYNGIGNFVFNTGNNNNVQGTLSVTILTPVN